MNRLQIQLGFVLILISLLSGFGMPFYTSPRLGLAAHVVGITGGLVLIALGALAPAFVLGPRSTKVMKLPSESARVALHAWRRRSRPTGRHSWS